MLTPADHAVNAPRAVMLSIAELAARDGVSKPAVSRKVKQLVAKGLDVERDEQGRVAKLNAAQYDHLRNRTDDPSKAQRAAPAAPPPAPPADETYTEALRQKTWHEAERARLKLEEEKRELVRVASIADAVVACSEALVRAVDHLPLAADDLAAAVARKGVAGLRNELKALATRLRADMADALQSLAVSGLAAPAASPPTERAEPLALPLS